MRTPATCRGMPCMSTAGIPLPAVPMNWRIERADAKGEDRTHIPHNGLEDWALSLNDVLLGECDAESIFPNLGKH